MTQSRRRSLAPADVVRDVLHLVHLVDVDPPRNWQLGTVTVILLTSILRRPGHWQPETALSESGAVPVSFDTGTCATASDWRSAYPKCQWRAAQSSGSPPGEAASDSEARRPNLNLKISSEGVLTSYDAHGLRVGVSEL